MMNSNAASKLSKLENVQIREWIENWFSDLNRRNRDFEQSNNNTQLAYESELRQYFFLKGKEKGKELEYLTMDDISITQEDFENYIDKLCAMKDHNNKNKYVNKTINKKTTAIKSFVRFMKKKKVIDIDISYLELIKGEKERRNSYGALEPDEVMQMAELALEERDKGEIKRLLILTAFKTGLRISEITGLTWNSFIKKGEEIYICGVGKGNKPFEIKINQQLYDEILTLNNGQQSVFSISPRRITDMMDRLRKKLNIQPERQIVFHSIRKAYGTLVYKLTGDIEQARKSLRHENINTTQIYLNVNDYEVNDIVFSVEKIETDLFKNVSHDDLIAAIENCPKNVKLILNMNLQSILNNK